MAVQKDDWIWLKFSVQSRVQRTFLSCHWTGICMFWKFPESVKCARRSRAHLTGSGNFQNIHIPAEPLHGNPAPEGRDRGDEWMISSTTEYETFPIIWRCSLQPLTLNSLKKSHFRRRKKCFIHCSPPSLPPPCKRLRGHSISHPNHQYKRRLFPTWNKIYTTHIMW